jgi:hypothetical protein
MPRTAPVAELLYGTTTTTLTAPLMRPRERTSVHACLGCFRYTWGRPSAGRCERFYDPADLDPCAPRLRIRKGGGLWELWDDGHVLLGGHPRLPDALDAALERSAIRFSEILVRASDDSFEWSVRHNPEMQELARLLTRFPAARQEAAD